MTSLEVASVMREAIEAVHPDWTVSSYAAADGGEGTVEAFLAACGGRRLTSTVAGPLGQPVEATWAMLDSSTAVLETASAAGLGLVDGHPDPSLTTTYGLGQLVVKALDEGARRILIGLGGSATNDAGCGLACACGIRFLDDGGEAFTPVGANLDRIASIDYSHLDPRLEGVEIMAICDVSNPFYGPQGAARIYAPQKGADDAMVALLDRNMMTLASKLDVDVQSMSGSGAAGGLGGGLVAFLGARLSGGSDAFLDAIGFEEKAAKANLIITGEGRIDGQSLSGKLVVGIARRAKRLGVPVIALVGDALECAKVYEEGVSAVFSTNRRAVPFSEARLSAKADLRATMDDLLRFAAITRRLE